MVELRDRVFAAVLAAGFDRVGAIPLTAAGDPGIREWLAAGHHGEMGYLERHAHAKADPAAAFPEFSSVVVAILEYGDGEPPRADPATANISRYAVGDDYHIELKNRFKRAARELRAAVPDMRTRIFVDTGPINEKLVAQRAGLGWVGKHTNLIARRTGSYFFIGLMLVDADLSARPSPSADNCGTCAACIPACPTGAIIAPHVLDARRCISYLTIELRGSIPREFRPLVGNRIFGCDDCQEACPWNRFARQSPPRAFRARKGLRDRKLEAWLLVSPGEWHDLFSGTALHRTGFRSFLRNVLVAVGCTRDPGLAPVLTRFLDHPEPVVRIHAAWALGHVGGRHAQEALELALRTEQEPEVRSEMEDGLAEARATSDNA